MKGVNDTAPLKFDHPGLETMVTREVGELAIQTDLGSTETQFVVVTITGLSALVTYTDVHPRRIRFLHDMLRPYGIQWSAVSVSPGADYDVSVGRFTGGTPERSRTLSDVFGFAARLPHRLEPCTQAARAASDEASGHQPAQVGRRPQRRPLRLPPGRRPRRDRRGPRSCRARPLAAGPPRRMARGGRRPRVPDGRPAGDLVGPGHRPIVEPRRGRHRSGAARASPDGRRLIRSRPTPGTRRSSPHSPSVSAKRSRMRSATSRCSIRRGRRNSPSDGPFAWIRLGRPGLPAARSVPPCGISRVLLAEADGASDALEEAAFMLTLLPDSVDSETLVRLVGLADLVLDTVSPICSLSRASPRPVVDVQLLGCGRLLLVDIDRLGRLAPSGDREAADADRTAAATPRQFSRFACPRRRGARL